MHSLVYFKKGVDNPIIRPNLGRNWSQVGGSGESVSPVGSRQTEGILAPLSTCASGFKDPELTFRRGGGRPGGGRFHPPAVGQAKVIG